MPTDDLLQFQNYTNASNTPAQISVNSPTHFPPTNERQPANSGLNEFIYDMSNSVEIIGNSNMGGVITENDNLDGGSMKSAADAQNLPQAESEMNNKNTSFLSIEYYQKFFNVDTYMVLERITNSMIPKPSDHNYLRANIGQNPDLYGPFWITVTLIFSIGISGNIASYLQYASEDYHWRYNFHLVSYAATSIFIYVNLVPIALWATFKYSLKPVEEGLETENAAYTPSLLSLMCIYGYSLFIYIPVSILWVIQISLLQWLLVITAALLSGSVLIIVLAPALRNSKISIFLVAGILATHLLLAAGFMLYFFHVPNTSTTHIAAAALSKTVIQSTAAANLSAA